METKLAYVPHTDAASHVGVPGKKERNKEHTSWDGGGIYWVVCGKRDEEEEEKKHSGERMPLTARQVPAGVGFPPSLYLSIPLYTPKQKNKEVRSWQWGSRTKKLIACYTS